MKARVSIFMEIPELIGIMGLAVKPSDPDEDEDIFYNITTGGVQSRIEIVADYGLVRATYKGDVVFEAEIINNTQMIALIEECIKILTDRYKLDGHYQEE